MKRRLLFFVLMGMLTGAFAQSGAEADTMLHTRLREAEVARQKGELYKAAYGFQLALNQAVKEHRNEELHQAYKGLIYVFEKSYNYPKAFYYQSALISLDDSLRQNQSIQAVKEKELLLQKKEQDLKSERLREKETITNLEEKLSQQIRQQEMLLKVVYGLIGFSALLIIVMFVFIVRLLRKKPSAPGNSRFVQETEASKDGEEEDLVEKVKDELEQEEKEREAEEAALDKAEEAEELAQETGGERKEALLDLDEIPRFDAVTEVKGSETAAFKTHFPDSFFLAGRDETIYLGLENAATGSSLLVFAASGSTEKEETIKWNSDLKMLAAGPVGSPNALLDGFIDRTSDRQAVLCIFDLKGGWLRFACEKTWLWLLRKEAFNEFGTIGEASGPEKRNPGFHTLGLRRGDCLYVILNGEEQGLEPLSELKKLLLTVSNKPMDIQKEKIIAFLASGEGEELKVSLLGMRI